MVFVSFEGLLDSLPPTGAPDVPSLEVVVTPGSPPKQSMKERGGGSPLKAADAQYVMFIQDKVVTASTYALRKSHVEIAALHDAIRTCILHHPCTTFACCGPLRRLAKKSARPPAPSMKLRLFDGTSGNMKVDAACTQRTWVVETFVKDLLAATTGRDADCAAVDGARNVLHAFLDLPSRRQVHVLDTLSALQQTQAIAASPAVDGKSPQDDTACPICLFAVRPDQPDHDATVVTLTCGHSFHGSCVEPWLLTQRFCPVCRRPLVSTSPPPTSGM